MLEADVSPEGRCSTGRSSDGEEVGWPGVDGREVEAPGDELGEAPGRRSVGRSSAAALLAAEDEAWDLGVLLTTAQRPIAVQMGPFVTLHTVK